MSQAEHAERLQPLRAAFSDLAVDYFIVPRSDEFQGEYVPAACERLAWISGFSGSAGLAIVGRDAAAIFTDGRYTIQVRQETSAEHWCYQPLDAQAPGEWLKKQLQPGQVVAIDPWLHTPSNAQTWRSVCEASGAVLQALEHNPIDALWQARPALPSTPLFEYPEVIAGCSREDKVQRLRNVLQEQGVDATLLSAPDALAWLLNCRARDLPFMPVPLAYALLSADHIQLFVEAERVQGDLQAALGDGVECVPRSELLSRLSAFAGRVVALDAATASEAIYQHLLRQKADVRLRDEPIALWKACKTPAEQAAIARAHVTDGVALCQFLHWLEGTIADGHALDELGAAAQLAQFRAQSDDYICPSFETISAVGPNGALCHYRVSEQSNRAFQSGDLYLVDSGGQYLEGTTDVTRTIPVGPVSAECRRRFTRVLQGHIGLARARFPEGTTGSALDCLARMPLWRDGLDFEHGTGHGVGCFLGVHEGPQRISKVPNRVALQPGMVVSNEPGYYQEGGYGIRIENLECVVEDAREGDERPMRAFKALTLAPIERDLIEVSLLTEQERDWLDAYHQRVYQQLSPHLSAEVREWLERKTAKLDVAN